jgi:hypothetical protein
MAHLAAQVNSWKDQTIRQALAPVQRLAEEAGAAVVVIAHLNKGQSADPLQRLGGSIGIPAAALASSCSAAILMIPTAMRGMSGCSPT